VGRELFCIAVMASARVLHVGLELCCRAAAKGEAPTKLRRWR
jgi:hypothetical protein